MGKGLLAREGKENEANFIYIARLGTVKEQNGGKSGHLDGR